MIEIISGVLLLIGAFFMLVAAIGILRMPDLLTRMHASSKAGTLGAGLILVAVAVDYGDLGVTARALVAIVFLVLTAPVGAHVIARAAYFVGVPLWQGTVVNEIEGRYDIETHDLESGLRGKSKANLAPARPADDGASKYRRRRRPGGLPVAQDPETDT
jgi:multicomponent Na+:H+ antiporter subunit G